MPPSISSQHSSSDNARDRLVDLFMVASMHREATVEAQRQQRVR
jgi:hypothetical protein